MSDNLTWRKGIFGWRKEFSGNTENVVGFEVLRKIVRRCFRGEVVRFNRSGVFGWYAVHFVCWFQLEGVIILLCKATSPVAICSIRSIIFGSFCILWLFICFIRFLFLVLRIESNNSGVNC